MNQGLRVEASATDITVADYGNWVVRVQARNNAGCDSPAPKGFTVEAASTPTPYGNTYTDTFRNARAYSGADPTPAEINGTPQTPTTPRPQRNERKRPWTS